MTRAPEWVIFKCRNENTFCHIQRLARKVSGAHNGRVLNGDVLTTQASHCAVGDAEVKTPVLSPPPGSVVWRKHTEQQAGEVLQGEACPECCLGPEEGAGG